jgi:HD-GYP domain-containing protein (c-di-GMP phosphodiesterase class II)
VARCPNARSALAELRANTGSQFCPVVVEALEALTAAQAPPLRAVF